MPINTQLTILYRLPARLITSTDSDADETDIRFSVEKSLNSKTINEKTTKKSTLPALPQMPDLISATSGN